MKLTKFFLFFLTFCLFSYGSYATSLGVVPDKLSLSAGENAAVWVINPNPYDLDILIISSCPDLIVDSADVLIAKNSRKKIFVNVPENSRGCDGHVSFAVNNNHGSAISIAPALEIPISITPSMQVFKIHSVNTGYIRKPEPSAFNGVFLSLAIVLIGIVAYFYSFKCKNPGIT